MSRTRKLIIALVALLIPVLLLLALRPAPVPVTVTPVEQGPMQVFVEDEGWTRLREPFTVTAPMGGYLRRVPLEPGDPVAAGAPLFWLEPPPVPALDAREREQAAQAVAAARARLEVANAQLEAARSRERLALTAFGRIRDLQSRGLAPEEALDRATSDRETAAAERQRAAKARDAARAEWMESRLRLEMHGGVRSGEAVAVPAPVDGVVMRRHRRSEGPVAAGEPVLELGDPAALEVRVDLLSMDAVQVRPGMRVILERWGGGEPLEGRVRRVEPSGFEEVSALGVEERRVTVWSVLTSPRGQWSRLGDGYRVEARFVLWEGEDVIQVPTSTLFRHGEGQAVFVVESGRARLRPVETGRSSGLWTQILSGLDPGESVIRHPGSRVADGVSVAPEPG
ncbi:efflux RND transporter periplasmic adaptor subunit [Ectothiorhodospira mobilis]|uniref:efflux RND transporter periplasmic adaptor subunit n=1 Tax=Ectothiorhodospira mobilis TaxID=195064 RepID=UPI0019054A46|nr:HlyD family efflux transporter periplasmic adaptor subunit [Ectothiorhodospira mobilis]MBK1691655.1 efflux transporter periplasmic adaptor subunit [Ectothiorhodospira mobilis]